MADPTRALVATLGVAIVLVSCTPASADPYASMDSEARAAIELAVGTEDDPGGELDAFWSTALADFSSAPYQSVSDIQAYLPGTLPDYGCMDGEDPQNWIDNAFYCGDAEVIGYDIAFLGTQLDSIGRLAPIMILAHEWGHHLQRVQGNAPDDMVQKEQQADCYAGVFAEHLSDAGALEEGEITESIFTFYELGASDPVQHPTWFDTERHGTAIERARAFGLGMGSGDASYCLGYSEFVPAADVTLGPFTFGVVPGIEVEQPDAQTLVFTSDKAVAVFSWVPDVAGSADPAQLLADYTPTFLAQPGYEDAVVEEITRNPISSGIEGSGASMLYIRPEPSAAELLAHGWLVVHVLPDGGALLLLAETPSPADPSGVSDATNLRFALVWQLCIEGIATYTCPSG